MSRKKSSSSLCDDIYNGSSVTVSAAGGWFESDIEAILWANSCAGVSGRVVA